MSVAIARRPRGTLDLQLKTDLVQDNLPAKVVDRVYIGSIHAAFNQDGLLARGITHVLNASGLPATFPRSFTYFNVDLRDKEEADILGALGAASVFIEAGTEKGGVLVHCAGGRSRSAAFIAAYLMMKQDFTFDQAVEQLKAARPVVAINRGFELQLRAYEATGYDVFQSHQLMLRARMKRLLERRQRVTSGDKMSPANSLPPRNRRFSIDSNGGGSVGSVGGGTISIPPLSPTSPRSRASRASQATSAPQAVRRAADGGSSGGGGGASTDINFLPVQVRQPRLRLCRPHAKAQQLSCALPELEQLYVCSGCGAYLFTQGNVLDATAALPDLELISPGTASGGGGGGGGGGGAGGTSGHGYGSMRDSSASGTPVGARSKTSADDWDLRRPYGSSRAASFLGSSAQGGSAGAALPPPPPAAGDTDDDDLESSRSRRSVSAVPYLAHFNAAAAAAAAAETPSSRSRRTQAAAAAAVAARMRRGGGGGAAFVFDTDSEEGDAAGSYGASVGGGFTGFVPGAGGCLDSKGSFISSAGMPTPVHADATAAAAPPQALGDEALPEPPPPPRAHAPPPRAHAPPPPPPRPHVAPPPRLQVPPPPASLMTHRRDWTGSRPSMLALEASSLRSPAGWGQGGGGGAQGERAAPEGGSGGGGGGGGGYVNGLGDGLTELSSRTPRSCSETPKSCLSASPSASEASISLGTQPTADANGDWMSHDGHLPSLTVQAVAEFSSPTDDTSPMDVAPPQSEESPWLYTEYISWMGDMVSATASSGTLSCPNPSCGIRLGEWSWEPGAFQCPITDCLGPTIALDRNLVRQSLEGLSRLDSRNSSRDSTPRESVSAGDGSSGGTPRAAGFRDIDSRRGSGVLEGRLLALNRTLARR